MRYFINVLSVGIVLLGVGCKESDYTRMVKQELAKNARQDSLLLGIYFGDTRKAFYEKCFALNKKKLVAQGPSNSSVQYNFQDTLLHEGVSIRLLFYPKFDEENILNAMDMEFSYSGWAPWNKQLQSDALLPKVRDLLQIWYQGNCFVEADLGDKTIPVKVDANRRIMIGIKDYQTVVVKIQDILHPKFKHSIG